MPPPTARDVTRRWLKARVELPTTVDEQQTWWARSREVFLDCRTWAVARGYRPPSDVVWGTTLTWLGIKSAVRKIDGRRVRMRNLRLITG